MLSEDDNSEQGNSYRVVSFTSEYWRLKRRDRQVYKAGELPDDVFDAIKNARMDERHAHLDELIKDWTP